MAVLSGLPAKRGKTWMVNKLQGLFGLECATVSETLLPPTPTVSETPVPTGSAVPSGKRIMLEDPPWLALDREGRAVLAAYAPPRLVIDMKDGLGVMMCEEVM